MLKQGYGKLRLTMEADGTILSSCGPFSIGHFEITQDVTFEKISVNENGSCTRTGRHCNSGSKAENVNGLEFWIIWPQAVQFELERSILDQTWLEGVRLLWVCMLLEMMIYFFSMRLAVLRSLKIGDNSELRGI